MPAEWNEKFYFNKRVRGFFNLLAFCVPKFPIFAKHDGQACICMHPGPCLTFFSLLVAGLSYCSLMSVRVSVVTPLFLMAGLWFRFCLSLSVIPLLFVGPGIVINESCHVLVALYVDLKLRKSLRDLKPPP
jgi:hypothetical protein